MADDLTSLEALHRSSGATLDERGRPVQYGPVAAAFRASHDAATLADRGDIAIVDMHGADVRRWANGMFTQNFRDLDKCRVVESGWCDDRGRLLGLMHAAFIDDDRLRVLLETGTASDFIDHFDRYVLVDDVEFEDRTDALHVLTAYGPRAAVLLGSVGLHAETGPVVTSTDRGQIWGSRRASVPSVDIIVPIEDSATLWSELITTGLFAIGQKTERVLRVHAGRVLMGEDVPPKALPHELGLRDRILSFEKGCYVGQETINRLDVRGQARKHLAAVVGDTAMPVGADVEVDGKSIGSVSSVVQSPVHGWVALAVVRRPHDEGADAIVDGAPVRVRPLPLDVPEPATADR